MPGTGSGHRLLECYLYAVESSALLLVQQGVVVSQLHQLIQLFVRILLLQLLQDTNDLEGAFKIGILDSFADLF